jgi:hypothetical protein
MRKKLFQNFSWHIKIHLNYEFCDIVLVIVIYQSKSIQDIKVFPSEEQKSFGCVQTLDSGASVHVADLLAVLKQPHHSLVTGTIFLVVLLTR